MIASGNENRGGAVTGTMWRDWPAMEQMVAHAIDLLLAKIANQDKPLTYTCFPNELVIRRSTGRQPFPRENGALEGCIGAIAPKAQGESDRALG